MERTASIIVVGVEGHREGDEALRFALEEAARTGDSIEVLTAWNLEPSPVAPYAVLGGIPTLAELEGRARRWQERAIARIVGDPPRVQVASRVLRGDPGVLLVEAARHARLLVVGSRPLGPIRAALLGSVSRYCAHHAPCPVVVVPAGEAALAASNASAEVVVTR